MDYLTENKILYRYQSGFGKNHLTDASLSYLTDKILTGFDSRLLTGMILIDLQNIINQDILLKKNSVLRFPDRSMNWFKLSFQIEVFKKMLRENILVLQKLTVGCPRDLCYFYYLLSI